MLPISSFLPTTGTTSDVVLPISSFLPTTVFVTIIGGVDVALLTGVNNSDEPKYVSNLSAFDLISSFCLNKLPCVSLEIIL